MSSNTSFCGTQQVEEVRQKTAHNVLNVQNNPSETKMINFHAEGLGDTTSYINLEGKNIVINAIQGTVVLIVYSVFVSSNAVKKLIPLCNPPTTHVLTSAYNACAGVKCVDHGRLV